MKRLFFAAAFLAAAFLAEPCHAAAAGAEKDSCLERKVQPLIDSSDYQAALSALEDCEGRRCESDGSAFCAEAWRLRGLCLYYLDDYRGAAEFWERALAVFRTRDNPRRQAWLLNALGQVWYDLGEQAKSMDYYREALPLFEKAGDGRGAASALHSIGSIHGDRGEYERAFEFFQRSLERCRREGIRYGEGFALNSMGNLHRRLGQFAEAEKALLECLASVRAVGDRDGEAYALNSLGAVCSDLKRRREALSFYQKALELWREEGRPSLEAMASYNVAMTHRDLGEHEEALEKFLAVLKIYEDMGYTMGAAETLASVAETLLNLNRPAEAAAYSARSLDIARRLDVPYLLWEAYLVDAFVFRRSADLRRAAERFRSAIGIIEGVRGGIAESGMRASFLGRNLQIYEELVETLLTSPPGPLSRAGEGESRRDGEDVVEAFSVSERMKARSFLDEIGKAKSMRGGVPAELLARRAELEARMKWLREKS